VREKRPPERPALDDAVPRVLPEKREEELGGRDVELLLVP
jgi:hypothetical protein